MYEALIFNASFWHICRIDLYSCESIKLIHNITFQYTANNTVCFMERHTHTHICTHARTHTHTHTHTPAVCTSSSTVRSTTASSRFYSWRWHRRKTARPHALNYSGINEWENLRAKGRWKERQARDVLARNGTAVGETQEANTASVLTRLMKNATPKWWPGERARRHNVSTGTFIRSTVAGRVISPTN